MDISEMMIGGADKPTTSATNHDVDAPQDLDGPVLAHAGAAQTPTAEMSAVERIRAYRDGSLAPPMIGRLDETDNAGENDAAAEPNTVDPDFEDDFDHSDDGDISTTSGDVSGDAAGADVDSGNKSQGRAFRMPRKALFIAIPAAVLLAAGAAIPSIGAHNQTGKSTVVSQNASGNASTPTSAAPTVIPDEVIKPVSAQAAEYPISLTSPMDAFSGDKAKAWVCAGLDGTVLTITLPSPTAISEIGIVPGFDGRDKDGSDQWGKHRIVTAVAYYLDYGAAPVTGDYVNKRQRQTTKFNGAITQTIRIVILGTQDVSGKGPTPDAGTTSTSPAPGLLGDLSSPGPLSLDPSSAAPSPQDRRPATFAIGSIEIIGHPAR